MFRPVEPSRNDAVAGGREPSRFYPPRFKLLFLAAGSLFFAAIGHLASRSDVIGVAVLGWTAVVLFLAATGVMVLRALRPGPTLIIDEEGITDRTSLVQVGLVRWTEITVVRKREIGRGYGSERMLEVVLDDPAAFMERPRTLPRRLTDRFRRLTGQPPVGIPGSMVSRPMQAVIDEVKAWRPGLEVLELPPRLPRPRLFGRRHQFTTRQHPRPPRW